VDPERADLAYLPQPDEAPGLAGISGLVDAAALDHIAPDRRAARADIDDVRVGLGELDGTDRAGGEEPVRDIRPRLAVIAGLPDTASGSAHVESKRLPAVTSNRGHATAAQGPDHAVAEPSEERWIDACPIWRRPPSVQRDAGGTDEAGQPDRQRGEGGPPDAGRGR